MANRFHMIFLLSASLVLCMENDYKIQRNLDYEPSWHYKCIPNGGCQRSPSPHNTTWAQGPQYETVDMCRLVCGTFGPIWPQPVTATLGTTLVNIHPNYTTLSLYEVPQEVKQLLAEMYQVFTANLQAECGGQVTDNAKTSVIIYVSVKSPSEELSWDTNEEYTLKVQSKDSDDIIIKIAAETVYGARHALESLSHLIASNTGEYSNKKTCSLYIVSEARITDKPAYKYRGLLMDSSRNFYTIADIKRTMDGMAATKLNVFHWHITDSQSFPLESQRVPQFTRYGAYSPSEIYTVREVKDLVKYAQIRGIRIVLEIDAPAHAGNGWQWGPEHGLGDLAVCVNKQPWKQFCIEAPCGQLNPANPQVYRVLRDLYRDIAEMLPRPTLFHMGGDEVFFPCWNSSPEILTYMASKGLQPNEEGFIKLWAEFHSKALEAWDEQYKAAGGEKIQPVMLWSSRLTQADQIQSYLNKTRYVIQVWEPLDSPLLGQLLHLGYKVVSVPKDIWYLDHGFWGSTKYSNWRRMYNHMLPNHQNVVGGEVAMWSEFVDAHGLDTRVWPRAAAVGERLWSDPRGDLSAEPRLQLLRSRLVSRGLSPDVLTPGWCAQNDFKCL